MSHYPDRKALKNTKSAAAVRKRTADALEKIAAKYYDGDTVLRGIFDAAERGEYHLLILPENPQKNPIDLTKTEAAKGLKNTLEELGYMVSTVTICIEPDAFREKYGVQVSFNALVIVWDDKLALRLKTNTDV